MKKDIILAGVGGQGILSIATVLGEAALTNGLHIKQADSPTVFTSSRPRFTE